MTPPDHRGPAGPPPPPQFGQQWGMPPPPPPGFYPPAMFPPPRQTNSMAVAALVCAFILPPLAIVLGHVALSQIRRTNEEGRSLAIAGLVIGYVATGLFLLGIIVWVALVAWLASSVDRGTYNSMFTPTTTTSYPGETSEQAIKNARVGQCIHMEDNGSGNVTVVSRIDCSSSYATHRVTSVTSSTSNCSYDWVRSADHTVVLCLAEE